MNYTECCEWIKSISDFNGGVPGCETERELLKLLGDPQTDMRFVHIAGTNGKGTTAGMIALSLRHAGIKTGLYTSPSLERWNERINIGRDITNLDFSSVFTRIRTVIEKSSLVPTRFDILTAGAILFFKEQHCEFAVMEVGLGGKYDATNAIPAPDAVVLTSISLDHTKLLGKTISAIATEKSGIIKQGTGICVSAADQKKEAQDVIRDQAEQSGVRLCTPSLNDLKIISCDITGTSFAYCGCHYRIKIPGDHFVINALSSIEVLKYLSSIGCPIRDKDIQSGVSSLKTKGRMNVLSKQPLIISDGAHNPGAADRLAETIKKLFSKDSVTVICGMYADKDCRSVVKTLASMGNRFIAIRTSGDRAEKAETLAEYAKDSAAKVMVCEAIDEALTIALAQNQGRIIVCCGSFGVYSGVKRFVKTRKQSLNGKR